MVNRKSVGVFISASDFAKLACPIYISVPCDHELRCCYKFLRSFTLTAPQSLQHERIILILRCVIARSRFSDFSDGRS